MGRLFWRNSVLLLRISLFFVYTPANFEGTLAGFPPDFCLFYPGNFSHSTKPAPAVFGLVVEIGQHRPSLAPRCALPHPLQNRVPRVQVLLPLPKTALLLLQWRCFLSLGGTSWQRGTAAPRAVRVVGRVRAGGTQATSRPRRQPRQVLLPLPENRRKHWVFAGFLFACVAWEWGSFWFGHWVFPSGFTRSQPFPSPPAPKTHPVLPFFGFSGCVFVFSAFLDVQNFRLGFCVPCRIAVTNL